MPNNRLLVRPNIVVVDSSKEPVEEEVLLVYDQREISLKMERRDSKPKKKGPTGGSRGLRRNSTTVSSIKKKNFVGLSPKIDPNKKSASFEEQQHPSESESPHDSRLQPLKEARPSVSDQDQIEDQKNPSAAEEQKADNVEAEEDLLAELNANIATMIEKDKAKKTKKKPAQAEESGEASSTSSNPNLLKPTDIPAHVLEQKLKGNNTTEEKKEPEVAATDPEPVVVNANKANVPSPKTKKKDEENKKASKLAKRKTTLMIPPELASSLTPQQRERRLKEIVVNTFKTAAERNDRARNNMWLRWKYIDDIKTDMDWLESNGVEDMGWAVGRRIYEKDEIERVDEKFKMREKSALFESRKISLKEAPGIFGLWDNVYHPSVVKSLDGASRWDPTKSAAKDGKKSSKKTDSSDSDSEEDGEDNSDEDEDDDEDAQDQYDDEGNIIEKKKKKKKRKKKGAKREKARNEEGGLSNEDTKFLLEKTSYSEEEIRRWFTNFQEECPSGKLSKSHLQRLFKRVFPIGDSEQFCDLIFRLFDSDKNNVLEFKEFIQAIDVVTRKSEDERLKWAFRLYDSDGSGKINVKEMASVLETLEGLEGKAPGQAAKEANKKSPAYVFAEKVFKLMDDDQDGEISVEEFVKGYQKLRARQNSNSVTVTAYVHEKIIEKPIKPKGDSKNPAPPLPDAAPIVSRRKSLRDATKVKPLFDMASS